MGRTPGQDTYGQDFRRHAVTLLVRAVLFPSATPKKFRNLTPTERRLDQTVRDLDEGPSTVYAGYGYGHVHENSNLYC